MHHELTSVSSTVNIGDVIVTCIFFLLVILFVISLVLFIKSRARIQKENSQRKIHIEQKLDKIIALLEKKDL